MATISLTSNVPIAALSSSPAELQLLIQEVVEGNSSAFSRLHRLAAPTLKRYARRVTFGSGSSEDVLQEAFIAIWQSAHSFDAARASPMAWMCTIVRNKAVDMFRRNTRSIPIEPFAREAENADSMAMEPCERLELARDMAIMGPVALFSRAGFFSC